MGTFLLPGSGLATPVLDYRGPSLYYVTLIRPKFYQLFLYEPSPFANSSDYNKVILDMVTKSVHFEMLWIFENILKIRWFKYYTE